MFDFGNLARQIAQRRKLGSIIAMLWGSAGIGALLGFVAQAIFARHLSVEQYGFLAAATAAVNILGPVAAFGLGLMWLQKYALEGPVARRWIVPSWKVAALAFSISLSLYCFWVFFISKAGESALPILYIAPMVAAAGAIQLAESRYQLEGRFRHVAVWQLSKFLALLLIAISAYMSGFGLDVIGILIGISMSILAICALAATRALATGKAHIEGHDAKIENTTGDPAVPATSLNTVRDAWAFAATGIVYLIFFQSDILILLTIDSPAAAGIYGVAIAMISGVYLLPRILYRKVLMPRFFRWYYQEPAKLRRVFVKAIFGPALLAIPLAVVLAMLAPPLVDILFGEKYAESAVVFQLFCICLPFRFASTGLAAMIAEPGHIRIKLAWQTGVAALNVAGNFILIPHFSFYGAAISTIAVEIILTLVYLALARRFILGRT